tara:strand:- start:108 stop:1826 length:1719 start_codon:yes stop_codon:yes gene_type:complete
MSQVDVKSTKPLLQSFYRETEHETDDCTDTATLLQPAPPSPFFLNLLVSLSAFSGFLFGYDTGVVSGALVLVKAQFHLTSFQHEIVVSATIFTAIIGSTLAIPLNQNFGRKPCILTAATTFLSGSLFLAFAPSLEWLIVGRLIVGIGIGIGSMVVPMYVSEIAPASRRGELVTLNNLFITGGQFSAAIISALLVHANYGWRWMFGLGAVPALIQLIGFSFMPESPRWLLKQGQREHALSVLIKVRGVDSNNIDQVNVVTKEFLVFENVALVQEQQQQNNSSRGICNILCTKHIRKALCLGAGLQFLQQISGINTVMYYGASIVQMAGFNAPSTAIYANVGLAASNFVFTIVGLLLVERMGRRKLLLSSLTGVVLVLGGLGLSFYLNDIASLPVIANHSHHSDQSAAAVCSKSHYCFGCVMDSDCGFCTNVDGLSGSCLSVLPSVGNETVMCGNIDGFSKKNCSTNYPGYVSVLLLVLYLAVFAPGMGPMPWTINSEIYPLDARSLCVGVATSVNWVSNLVVSLTFLSLINAFTAQGAFALYASGSLIGLVVLVVVLPETKGLKLNEVVDLFR